MKKIIVTFFLLCLFLLLKAQNIQVSVPNRVTVGENFRLTYTIKAHSVEDIRIAKLPEEIELIAGPYTSQQSSVFITNGKTQSNFSTTYTYTLYASKAGTYVITPAKIIVGGKSIVSKSVKIIVVGTSKSSSQNNTNNDTRTLGTKLTGKDLFLKVSSSKNTMYEQEAFLLTYKVYSLVELTSLEGKMPELTGIHTQEVSLPQQKEYYIETVNGRPYRCVTWSQYVVFPQITGKQDIPSITFRGRVALRRPSSDLFEEFLNGGSNYEEVEVPIKSPNLKFTVLPLPKRPSNFSGGVGKFSIDAHLVNSSIKVGDALKMQVSISGNGNLKLLKQPQVSFPSSFEKYDPKVIDKTKVTNIGVEGEMIYEYIAVPTQTGQYNIPSISFIYFDTETQTYKTLSTKTILVNVQPGKYNKSIIEDFSKEQDDDIKDIKKEQKNGQQKSSLSIGSLLYFGILLGLLCASTILWILLFKVFQLRVDRQSLKLKKVNKEATKRLRRAVKFMSNGSKDAFYDEVLRALWEYLSDKLSLPIESLNRETIVEKLFEYNIQENVISDIVKALDECEYARYAPGNVAGNMEKTYNIAKKAIISIEEILKKEKHLNKHMNLGVLILCLCFSLTASALTKQQADSYYYEKNYSKAIESYENLLKQEPSASLYYNLGNAYYRNKQLSLALLNYERALKLMPEDKDIAFNIAFVRNKTIDRIVEAPKNLLLIPYFYVLNLFGVRTWTIVSLIMFALLLIGILGYRLGRNKNEQGIGYYIIFFSSIIFILSTLLAIHQKAKMFSHNEAIIMSKSLNVKKVPNINSETDFILNEATKVYIKDKEVKGWYEIEVGDGRKGWVPANNLEII